MNTKKLLLLFTTSLVLGMSLICKDPQPVQAKCRSWDLTCTKPIRIPPISIPRIPTPRIPTPKINLPEINIPTPEINLPSVGSTNSESCLSVVTDSKYSFLIMNLTSGNVVFMVDNEVHTLRANDHKRFTSQRASGSDGCNIQYFPIPVITYHRVSGDIRTLSIGSGIYQFDEVGDETFLVPSSK